MGMAYRSMLDVEISGDAVKEDPCLPQGALPLPDASYVVDHTRLSLDE